MKERTLYRLRELRTKKERNTITAKEAIELKNIETTLTSNGVVRDLSEQYTVDEMITMFD